MESFDEMLHKYKAVMRCRLDVYYLDFRVYCRDAEKEFVSEQIEAVNLDYA